MVQYGKLPSRPKPQEAQYDPYSLVKLVINDLEALGRPVSFNAEPANANTVNDKDGNPIYPTSCVVQCPQCGGGITMELPKPNTGPCRFDCLDLTECKLRTRPVAIPTMPDPFRNPFLEGIMVLGEVDANLVSVLDIPPVPGGVVADRLSFPAPSEDEP